MRDPSRVGAAQYTTGIVSLFEQSRITVPASCSFSLILA